MKYLASIAMMLIVGCRSWPDDSALEHKIMVPAKCRTDRFSPNGDSDHDRYIEGYERGWSSYLERCVEDIDHEFQAGDDTSSGWWAAIEGYGEGAHDAASRVEQMIQRYGKEQTHWLLVHRFSRQKMK